MDRWELYQLKYFTKSKIVIQINTIPKLKKKIMT